MEVIFLGTNGWFDTTMGNTICILIRTAKHAIVLDAGNGISKLDQYVHEDEAVHLFLSHHHLDHIAGLHILAKFRFCQGLTIAGPEGTRRILDQIVNHPFTLPLEQLPYRVTVLELPRDRKRVPFDLATASLRHPVPTLGYRFEIDGKIVSYCPDTGYCPEAVGLARNADLLITECAYRIGEDQPDWPHLNPGTAARIARESGARKLVLVHFDASRYPSQESRYAAEHYAQQYHSDTIAAFDGTRVTVL